MKEIISQTEQHLVSFSKSFHSRDCMYNLVSICLLASDDISSYRNTSDQEHRPRKTLEMYVLLQHYFMY